MPKSLDLKLSEFKDESSTKKYNSKGLHFIIDIRGLSFEVLNSEEKLNSIFEKAINLGKMTLLDKKIHKFNPQGLTGFYLLAESHCSFHTWPEDGTITIDLFSCGDRNLTKKSAKFIVDSFDSQNINIRKFNR